MRNKVGREIPDELLTNGKEVFQGIDYRQGYVYQKATPKVRSNVISGESKVVDSIKSAIENSGLEDGMTISFHHHFRNGDYTMATVMDVIHEMGFKDIFVCASSLGAAQRNLVPMMEDGTVTGISSSGVRDKVGEAISKGKLKTPAQIRSHGGRVRAIETGEIHIDVAFIGAPTSDVIGNASGKGGTSECGVLSYANVDAEFADYVVVLTDTIVPTPNYPASISSIDVDAVVEIESVGDSAKIASGAIRLSTDPRELTIAEKAADVVVNTEYFKEGYTFQTGAGGPSLAVTQFLRKYMDEKGVKMGWALGGITKPMVDLLKDGYIGALLDTQSFDVPSVESVHETPNHFEITTSEYANPMNKGAYVNYLDYVILGALEIDTDFNVNVVQGSDGIIQGAPGGHPDTSTGSKVNIIVAPLLRSRISTIRDRVTSVTTPGEAVDVLVTDYGIAVNPLRQDLIDSLTQAGMELTTIEELKEIAYNIVGEPKDLEFEDEVVAYVEYRDGTIIDVIYKVKED